MATTKRQLSFYAESDVDFYLTMVGPGSKTAILNEAIRTRMAVDAIVDLNDGKRPQYFAALSDLEQSEVHDNLNLRELSRNDIDEQILALIDETRSPNWRDNTRRYLTLHNAKYKEPFKIKKMRTRKEIEEWLRTPAFPNRNPLATVSEDFGYNDPRQVSRDFDGPDGSNLSQILDDFDK